MLLDSLGLVTFVPVIGVLDEIVCVLQVSPLGEDSVPIFEVRGQIRLKLWMCPHLWVKEDKNSLKDNL